MVKLFPNTVDEALSRSLSDIEECWVEMGCCYTKRAMVRYFLKKCCDQPFRDFIGRLTCSQCGGRPQKITLDDGAHFHPGVASAKRLWIVKPASQSVIGQPVHPFHWVPRPSDAAINAVREAEARRARQRIAERTQKRQETHISHIPMPVDYGHSHIGTMT